MENLELNNVTTNTSETVTATQNTDADKIDELGARLLTAMIPEYDQNMDIDDLADHITQEMGGPVSLSIALDPVACTTSKENESGITTVGMHIIVGDDNVACNDAMRKYMEASNNKNSFMTMDFGNIIAHLATDPNFVMNVVTTLCTLRAEEESSDLESSDDDA